MSAYAQARVADSAGAAERAAQGYAVALALSPDNEMLAARTLSQAMAAGDRQLALNAARLLEKADLLAPDARLLLLSEALRTRDWKTAGAHVDRLERDQIFSFMTPILRAWIAYGSGKGDSVAILDATRADPLAGAYAAEHRPLMLLARGKEKAGVEAMLALPGGAGRASRLRIAGAALLAEEGDRKEARALLAGDAEPLAAARRLFEADRPIPGKIDSAAAGIAEFFVRIAVDLNAQDVTPLALTYARLATFLAPENSETWLVTSELLAAADQEETALAVLSNVGPDDPFASSAQDARIRLLIATDRQDAALAEAEAAAKRDGAGVGDWTRLGELYTELKRNGDAAAAYDEALARVAKGSSSQPEWALHLLRGAALEEAERWPEAKAALEAAYKLAPDQPVVLNYLGYAQLERRENMVEAEKLVREASRLLPNDPAITDSLGWALFLKGDVPEAIPILERAARGEPADPAINEHLGDAYYSIGRRYEARYAWEAALLHADGSDAARLREKIETGLTPALASP